MPTALPSIPAERIERRILLVRGQKVLLDFQLAELYEVGTKVLNQAVKRNLDRFPEDFMFQLTWEEAAQISRSQIVPLESGKNLKYLPYAFTEQGVAMLSSVLRSPRAVLVGIAIMRTFVQLRQMLATNSDLARKLEALEQRYDAQFKVVFDADASWHCPRDKAGGVRSAAFQAAGGGPVCGQPVGNRRSRGRVKMRRFDAIRELMRRTDPPPKPVERREIGFHTNLPTRTPKGRAAKNQSVFS